jgi:5-methylthioadenosine/S-adenosylhomocysteine deaminase
VTPALAAVHCTQLNDADIERLSLARASIVHCPRSNMKLASGACRVADLLAAGVNVALGTDGAASNNRLDIWSELQMAALLGKHVAADATAVTAADALKMATINGANALGLGDETGSIEMGKAADLVCVELQAPLQTPAFDPISLLVYSAAREQVTDVWVAGQHLVDRGKLARLDLADIASRAAAWTERMTVTS